jgi:hypothetical protein
MELNSPSIQFVASISSILDIFLAAKAQLLPAAFADIDRQKLICILLVRF